MRPIDADKIIECFDPNTWHGEMMIAIANGLPTIEPKRGEWIDNECFDEKYGHSYDCGLCGYSVIGQQNFCPNCGADNRGCEHDKK